MKGTPCHESWVTGNKRGEAIMKALDEIGCYLEFLPKGLPVKINSDRFHFRPVNKEERLRHIDDCLQEIGCNIAIPANGGPIKIEHGFFHFPRKVGEKVERVLSPREEILNRYVRECNKQNIPAFATGGRCFSCGFDLVDVENNCMKGTTGCPRCHKSFCD